MATKTLEESIKSAISSLKNGAYHATAIKIELEGELGRGSEECYECDNEGQYNCGNCDGEGCGQCDDNGYIVCEYCDGNGSFSSDHTCQQFIMDNVSRAAKEKLVYGQFYNDGSVDSEFTFTLMIDDIEYALEYINAFKKLAVQVGNGLDVEGAGMHIALLNEPNGNYPNGNNVRDRHYRNFKYTVDKLMPALYFLGSNNWKSRSTGYRHPLVARDHFDTNYVLVHNGWISNAEAMRKKHKKLGIIYTSDQPDDSFNDSEALLWELALVLEGKQDKIEAYGPIAFICTATDKKGHKKLYFGRNSNPLKMHHNKKHIYLSSEGKGQPIASDKLFTFDYQTNQLIQQKFDMPSYSSYVSDDYYTGEYAGNYDYPTNRIRVPSLFNEGYDKNGWLDKNNRFHMWDDETTMQDIADEEAAEERDNIKQAIELDKTPNELQFTFDVRSEYQGYMERFAGNYADACASAEVDQAFLASAIDEQPEDAKEIEYQCRVLGGVVDKLLSAPGWVDGNSFDSKYSTTKKVMNKIVKGILQASNG